MAGYENYNFNRRVVINQEVIDLSILSIPSTRDVFELRDAEDIYMRWDFDHPSQLDSGTVLVVHVDRRRSVAAKEHHLDAVADDGQKVRSCTPCYEDGVDGSTIVLSHYAECELSGMPVCKKYVCSHCGQITTMVAADPQQADDVWI